MKISRNFIKIFLGLFLIAILTNIITPFFGVWNIYYLAALMIFFIVLFFLMYRKRDNGTVKFFKFLILLIPIIVLGFIVYSNFVASQDFNYFYNIGSKEDTNKPYLTPINRMSEINNESDINYRNITSQLVYFNINIPKNTDSLDVSIKIKDSFPYNTAAILGAKNKEEWSYQTKAIYSSGLNSLVGYNFTDSEHRIYRINKNMPLLNNISEIPRYSIVAENIGLIPRINTQTYNLKTLTITTGLRESHTFYIYLDDSLNLQVKKQDLNWYEGSDELTISLYDLYGNLIGNTTITDDEITTINKSISKIQTGQLNIENLTRGIYILKFSKYDGIIKEIKLNTNKIVTNKLFLADNNIYINGSEKESSIYLKANKKSEMSLTTYHKQGFQNIKINKENILLNNTDALKHNLSSGEYTINSPKNNIIISSPNWISFSKDSYFEPFDYSVISIPNTQEEISKLDYIVTDYNPSEKQGDWLITKTSFNIKDLYIKDGKLNVLLNIPHLGKEDTSNYTIPIDWINITIHKDGIIKN